MAVAMMAATTYLSGWLALLSLVPLGVIMSIMALKVVNHCQQFAPNPKTTPNPPSMYMALGGTGILLPGSIRVNCLFCCGAGRRPPLIFFLFLFSGFDAHALFSCLQSALF